MARRRALEVLTPRYSAAGSPRGWTRARTSSSGRNGAEGFEDGTLPFTAIAAIPAGFGPSRGLRRIPPAHHGDGVGDEKSAPGDGDSTQNRATNRRGGREGAERADAHARAGRGALRYVAALPRTSIKRRSRRRRVRVVDGGVERSDRAGRPRRVPARRHRPRPHRGVQRVEDGRDARRVRRAVERACAASGVHVRTGCCCNPGACDYFTSLPLARASKTVDDDDDDDDDDGTVRRGDAGATPTVTGWGGDS